MHPNCCADVIILKAKSSLHSGHPKRIELAGRFDATFVVWQVLAVVVQPVGIRRTRHRHARHLVATLHKALIAKRQSKPNGSWEVARNVASMLPSGHRIVGIDFASPDTLGDEVAP